MTELAIPTTDLAPSDQSDVAIDRILKQAKVMTAAHQLGSALARTAMVPEIYQQFPDGKKENAAAADNATAAILYGAELGLSAVQSLQNIFIVRGKPAVYSRTMVAQVLAAGHQVREVEASPTSVTWTGKRGDTGVEFTSTWTIERAKTAGFLSNKLYSSIPTEMLRAKAQAEVCRTMAPDVLLGMSHSVEDLNLQSEPVKVKSERIRTGTSGLGDALGINTNDVPDVSDHASVEMITGDQLKKLHATFGDVGLTDREQGLAYLSNILDREVTSSKDLTKAEASRVFDELAKVNEPANGGEPA